MLIDTHAHLFWEGLKEEVEGVIERAKEAGVEKIVVPAVDFESGKKAIGLARKYPSYIYVAVGLHPESARRKEKLGKEIEKIRKLIRENKKRVVAVGEVGIDLKNKKLREFLSSQRKVFEEMIEIANQEDLPIIVHTRESLGEVLKVIDGVKKRPKGVFHCFSFGKKELEKVLRRGFMVSFCGNVTWSRKVKELVKQVPEEKLLLETDSPFMTPRDKNGDPMGGNLRNEPVNVRILARVQAELREQGLSELISKTGKNAKELFKL